MRQVTLTGFVILVWTVLAAATAAVTVNWQAPTTNADGSPLTDLEALDAIHTEGRTADGEAEHNAGVFGP